MTDPTRRDIRLGDLSALDHVAGDTPEPGLSGLADVATTQQMPAVPLPPRHPPAAPARHPVALWVLGTLVLLLLGTAGFLLHQQRELSRSLAVLEAKSRESVETLADRVSSTSTTLRSADSETQRSLNLLAGDIGRLDKALDRLDKSLAQLARQQADTATGLKGLAAELQRTVQAQQQADGQHDARLKSLAEALDAAIARQKALADQVTRLERNGDAAQLRTEVALLGASLREMQHEYDRRLKAGEQGIASADAFRRQVNATIDRLNQQVAELYQRR
ncbi:MAG: hypothetical protein ACOY33_02075 [Pseudomonadota bacterium]